MAKNNDKIPTRMHPINTPVDAPLQGQHLTPEQAEDLKIMVEQERNAFPSMARDEASGLRGQAGNVLAKVNPEERADYLEAQARALESGQKPSEVKKDMKERFPDQIKANVSARGKVAKAERMEEAVKKAEEGLKIEPYTFQTGVNRRKAAFIEAGRTDMMMPGEAGIAGGAWYLDSSRKSIPTMKLGFPVEDTLRATTVLSQGASPEGERAANFGLASARKQGEIEVTPDVTRHIGPNSAQFTGQRVPMSKLSPDEFSRAVTAPPDSVKEKSTGVDYRAIGSGSNNENVAKAARILSGSGEKINPHSAPKYASYNFGHLAGFGNYDKDADRANPGNVDLDPDIEGEYRLRAGHIGRVIRGEVAGGQGMFDFHGLRSSNKGLLSNGAPTAEDTWMDSISQGIPDDSIMKAAGDVPMGRKEFVRPGETHKTNIYPDPQVSSETLMHTHRNMETTEAAKQLQQDLDVDFTIPSVLVQESTWTGTRRVAGADPAYNAMMRQNLNVKNNSKIREAIGPSAVERAFREARPLDPHEVLQSVRARETALRDSNPPEVVIPKRDAFIGPQVPDVVEHHDQEPPVVNKKQGTLF